MYRSSRWPGGQGTLVTSFVVDHGKPPPEELQVERGPLEIGRNGKLQRDRIAAVGGRLADVTGVRRIFQEQRFRDLQQAAFRDEW